MVMLVRQFAAIAVLPFTVAVVIPIWIARQDAITLGVPDSVAGVAAVAAGIACLLVGGALFAASLFYFWSRGRGTLAPWDPPTQFVVEGPYRFVRNPMISGVIFVLLGEALVLRSGPHARWALLFALINAIYIPLVEEPMLAARFGEPYLAYRRAVRRFVPSRRSFYGFSSSGGNTRRACVSTETKTPR